MREIREFPDAVLMSAHNRDDLQALHGRIVRFFERDMVEQEFQFSYRQQAHVALLHQHCRVLEEKHDEHGTRIRVRAPGAVLSQLVSTFESPRA